MQYPMTPVFPCFLHTGLATLIPYLVTTYEGMTAKPLVKVYNIRDIRGRIKKMNLGNTFL